MPTVCGHRDKKVNETESLRSRRSHSGEAQVISQTREASFLVGWVVTVSRKETKARKELGRAGDKGQRAGWAHSEPATWDL